MHFSARVLSVVLALGALVSAELSLSFSVHPTIINDVPTRVNLSLGGASADDVLEVRTVLQLPSKRGPVFYANFSHDVVAPAGSDFALLPVYSVPTKTYIVSYSALVNTTDAEGAPVAEWVDAAAVEVLFRDRPVKLAVSLAASLLVLVVSSTFMFLFLRSSTPSFLRNALPAFLHPIVPRLHGAKTA